MREVAVNAIEIGSISASQEPITLEIIEKMIRQIDIATPLLSVERGVCSRNIEIMNRPGIEEKDVLIEIQKRFQSVGGWVEFLKELSRTPYYGFTVFEKIFNEDFTLKKLEFIPRQLVSFDKKEKVWKLKSKEKITIDESKFLIATYRGSLEYPQGDSMFNYGLHQAYVDITTLEAKVRGLAEKYGAVIPVFGFDPSEADTIEGKAKLKARAETLKEMTDKNVMGIPMNGDHSLKDSFFFISLADLKPEMHKVLLERLEGKIDKFIKGATFSEGATGSYSKDSIQQDEKEKIEDDIATFMAEQMYKLIKDDAVFFGYDPGPYYFTFEIDEGETAREELEKKRAEVKKAKVETFNLAKDHGYKVSRERMAEVLGIAVEDLEEVTPTVIGGEFSGMSSFLKKKEVNQYKLQSFKGSTEISVVEFSKVISEQIKKQFKKMGSVEDLSNFSLDLESLENHCIISKLNGMMDENEISFLSSEFSEFVEEIDPYNVPFSEAIDFFTSKQPELFKNIDPITLDVRTNFNWIKKSTELETTKKLIDNLGRSLEKGETFKDWKKRSTDVLGDCGFGENAWYLKNVYRTNLLSAYSVGRYEQQKATRKRFEYWQYDATMDKDTSKTCKELDGNVYKSNDPIWDDIYPLSHYQCRSGVISVTKEEFKEEKLELSKKPDEDFLESLGTFRGNPGTLWKSIEKSVKLKEKIVVKATKGVNEILEKNKKHFIVDFEIGKFKPKLERELAGEVLGRMGLNIPVKHKSMKGAYGMVRYRHDGKFVDMCFKTGDKRNVESRVKTMFHELFHASSIDAKEMSGLAIEEVMAESVGTHLAEIHNANPLNIANSYMDYLIKSLPQIRTLDEFADCKRVGDFGAKFLELGRVKTNELIVNNGLKITKNPTIAFYHKEIKKYANFLEGNASEYKEIFIDSLAGSIDISEESGRMRAGVYFDKTLESANSKEYKKILGISGDKYLYEKLFNALWKMEEVL